MLGFAGDESEGLRDEQMEGSVLAEAQMPLFRQPMGGGDGGDSSSPGRLVFENAFQEKRVI